MGKIDQVGLVQSVPVVLFCTRMPASGVFLEMPKTGVTSTLSHEFISVADRKRKTDCAYAIKQSYPSAHRYPQFRKNAMRLGCSFSKLTGMA